MKIAERILYLRKNRGLSQEELAEKMNVTRQAVSRWESGTALPDAQNILQLSTIFGVSADYLLNDDYAEAEPRTKNSNMNKKTDTKTIFFYLMILEVMSVLLQFMCMFILQNVFFAFLSFVPFAAMLFGFEFAYHKNKSEDDENVRLFRRRFYKTTAWLGSYFPIRFIAMIAVRFYPRPYSSLLLECLILIAYTFIAMMLNLMIDKNYIKQTK